MMTLKQAVDKHQPKTPSDSERYSDASLNAADTKLNIFSVECECSNDEANDSNMWSVKRKLNEDFAGVIYMLFYLS